MTNKITLANLQAGRIAFVGWTAGETDGYSVYDYFGTDGEYLGADEYGVEPVFTDTAMYEVIKNGHVQNKFESKYDALDYARCIMDEGWSGSLTVEKDGVIVFSEEN